MNRLTTPVYTAVGRRGLILIFYGLAYATLGIGLIVATPEEATRNAVYRMADQFAPLGVWGAGFVLAGLLAALSARWPTGRDSLGYMAISAASVMWSFTYFAAWILDNADSPHAWIGGGLFLMSACIVQVIAGWPEDPENTTSGSARG